MLLRAITSEQDRTHRLGFMQKKSKPLLTFLLNIKILPHTCHDWYKLEGKFA